MLEDVNKKLTVPKGKSHLIKEICKDFKSYSPAFSKVDAAAMACQCNGPAKELLTSTKLFLENIDFDLTYFPLKHLGYKFATVAASDLLAMNGLPTSIAITLAISNRFSVEAIEELMTGVRIFCDTYHINLQNFDLSTSVHGLIASVTMFGEVASGEKLITHAGAQENDLLCVTGDLASAYAGLLLLEREKKVFEADPSTQPDLEEHHYILERQLKPEPRFDVREALHKHGITPTSMTVVANGLAAAALHLCEASHTGCDIFENKLPIDSITFLQLKEWKIVGTTVALNGGDDYELLFTISQKDYEAIKKLEEVTVIGYIKDASSGCNLITNDQKSLPLQAQEFNN